MSLFSLYCASRFYTVVSFFCHLRAYPLCHLNIYYSRLLCRYFLYTFVPSINTAHILSVLFVFWWSVYLHMTFKFFTEILTHQFYLVTQPVVNILFNYLKDPSIYVSVSVTNNFLLVSYFLFVQEYLSFKLLSLAFNTLVSIFIIK